MLLDEEALAALDFGRIRERVAGATRSPSAMARALALVPTAEPARVAQLIAQTTETRLLVRTANFSLGRVDAIEEAVATAARGARIAATQLRAIADGLAAIGAAVRAIREADAEVPVLRETVAAAKALPSIVTRVTEAIDERGMVVDRASPELARTRRAIATAQDDARDRTAALARSSRFATALQDAIVTVRDGRFVVPVKAEHAHEVAGIVHDTSASGATLFVEPLETLEINNRVRALRSQEEHEVSRILTALAAIVGTQADAIAENLAAYGELDLAFARATIADRMNAVEPTLVPQATLAIVDGRHPLLDERAVPQSLRLDEDVQTIIISGPNMGGKTAALKMAGLFCAMAGCGLHVPAAEATIGGFTRVLADIGDAQSIMHDASTFSAHLAHLAAIVEHADSHSLILIDEIGAGTEPNAGAALAVAILEGFLAVGARCIVTTHATELKLFGAERDHVRNASVRFNPDTYQPTYHLDIGAPGQSLAFALARRMQLDAGVLARAEALLTSAERDYERALAELAQERTRASQEREALARDRVHLRTLEDQARKRNESLERERREFATRSEAQLATRLREFSAELARRTSERDGTTRPRVTRGQSELLVRTIDAMRSELGIRPAAPPSGPAPIDVGDLVFVVPLATEGSVIERQGDDVVVQIGSLRMTLGAQDVRRRGGAPPREREARAHAGATQLAAATAARAELDVRGKRFVEAEPIVDRWIDESLLVGASPLRLIHGKGTGLLGRGLQEFLRAHPHVRDVRFGSAEEGGSGVTVFELD